MAMRALVTGVSGQVGGCLADLPAPAGVTILPAGRDRLDLSDPDSIRRAMADLAPDVVVSCGAYTAVDKAESEPELAHAVNAAAPGLLAELCAARGAPILHLSTDYVFDGAKAGPWRRDDPVNPQGVYGASKEAGERAIRAADARHLILRTAWVYSARGHNFVRTMLRLGAERDTLRVVADQRGCPTSAADIATALSALLARLAAGEDLPWGTWHYAGKGVTTWHCFADAIFDFAAPVWGRRPVVEAITTAEYPTPARRPANSALDCTDTERELGLATRDWRDALGEVVAELVRKH